MALSKTGRFLTKAEILGGGGLFPPFNFRGGVCFGRRGGASSTFMGSGIFLTKQTSKDPVLQLPRQGNF